MLKLPLSSIKIDLNNPSLYDKYLRFINRTDLSMLFFSSNTGGLTELYSNTTFRIIHNKESDRYLYYSDELSLYFISDGDLELANSRMGYYELEFKKNEYKKLFNLYREILDEDESLTANFNLYCLENDIPFTK